MLTVCYRTISIVLVSVFLFFTSAHLYGKSGVLIAGIPKEFPPQYATDVDGKPFGFAVDLMDQIGIEAGYKIEYKVFPDWPETFAALRSGNVDLIPNLGISAQRKDHFAYTSPVETTPIELFVRNSSSSIRDTDNLTGKKVATVKGNVSFDLIKHYNAIPVVTSTVEDALFALLSSKVDAILYPTPWLMNVARKAGLENRIKTVGPPVSEVKRAIAVQKDNTSLLREIDSILFRFIGSPEYQKIYTRWFGKPRPYWNTKRLLGTVVSISAGLILLLLVWHYRSLIKLNRDLLKSIEKQKQVENALRSSESKVRLLLDSTAEAIFGVDRSGRCTFANPACVRLLGYTNENELLNKSIVNWIVRDEAKSTTKENHVLKALSNSSAIHSESEHIRNKNGNLTPIELWAHPILKNQKNLGGVVAFVDISERKLIQEKLLQSEQRLAESQKMAQLGHWDLDVVNGQLLLSKQIYSILGIDPTEFSGTFSDLLKWVHPDDRDTVDSTYKESLRTRNPYQIKHRLLLRDGTVKHVALRCENIFSPDGTGIFSKGTIQDITEQRLIEQELQQHREHLQELVTERTKELQLARDTALQATQTKSRFLATISHELRTPLNAIIGFSYIVKDGMAGEVNPEQHRQLSLVHDSATQLLDLINDILDLSKIEAGKTEIDMQYFMVEPLFKELKQLMSPMAQGKSLTLEILSEPRASIYSDYSKLRQVLLNLIGNAIKFTDQGTISINCLEQKEHIEISVSDTGKGIEQQQLKRIFDAFEQVDMGDSRIHTGSGLGLTISQRYILLMGAKISVKSDIGKGSTFTIQLPKQIKQAQETTQSQEGSTPIATTLEPEAL